MGASKTDSYTEEQNRMASLTKAIGHPARMAILDYLLKVDSCICGDIVNELPLAQPTISQHLRELKNVGIIKGSVEGSSICYCLDEEVWNELLTYFTKVSQKLIQKKSNCC
jgi:ArsR family transcriptional regulator, arsenate/arsenite/antimonite-responsive transcriptional repressor